MNTIPDNFFEKNGDEIFRESQKYVNIFLEILKEEGENGVSAIVQTAHQIVDNILEKTKLFEKTSCSKGCFFCCHDKILGTMYEMQYIQTRVSLEGIIPDIDRGDMQKSTPFDKLKWADKACVFLSKQGTCRIYEFRPLICKTHNAITPPENCDERNGPVRTRELNVIEIHAVQAALFQVCNMEHPPEFIPIWFVD